MTTPRIEEMVEKIIKDAGIDYRSFNGTKLKTGKPSQTIIVKPNISLERVRHVLTKALTETHQAGIDEGKYEERVKWQKYQDQVESIFAWLQGENGDFPDLSQKPHYSFRSQLRTMRKALQDNK